MFLGKNPVPEYREHIVMKTEKSYVILYILGGCCTVTPLMHVGGSLSSCHFRIWQHIEGGFHQEGLQGVAGARCWHSYLDDQRGQ